MPKLIALLALFVLFGVEQPAERSAGRSATPHWVGSWASSQMRAEGGGAIPTAALGDLTIRQNVRLSLGGERLRVRLSNAFGTTRLTVDAAHLARATGPASARIEPGGAALTFAGRPAVTIPPGAEATSDPVSLRVQPLGRVAVSLYLRRAPAVQTSHAWSRAFGWHARGNRVAAPDLPGARRDTHWYFLAGVDVEAPAPAAAIVTFGDSITDGFGVAHDSDRRWPDLLARRLQANPATRHLAVLNHGIGGNRVLLNGFGPSALGRFERDVLAQPGVRFLVLLEGVNDIGTIPRATVPERRAFIGRMIAAYERLIGRARARGIRVIGATILPFGGSEHDRPAGIHEADRQAINAWIRAPGHFDALLDFDALVRDPANPARMRRAYDSGDGLHPSIAGYQAMADSVPLSLFAEPGRQTRNLSHATPVGGCSGLASLLHMIMNRGEIWPTTEREATLLAMTKSSPIRATSAC